MGGKLVKAAYIEPKACCSDAVAKRFFAKVEILDSGCHEWTGAKRVNWYGVLQLNGSARLAHRIAWIMHNKKEIPVGMVVMHKCDNPACVNPLHLAVGTSKDNAEDRQKKKRGADVSGIKNPCAKLSMIEKVSIVKDFISDEMSVVQIANKYQVAVRTVYKYVGDVRRGKHGARNPRAKLTASIACDIRKRATDGQSVNQIAKQTKLSWPTVKRVLSLESFV